MYQVERVEYGFRSAPADQLEKLTAAVSIQADYLAIKNRLFDF
jgi:hypothetical protein